jgi:predicted nuclease of restriction endonuclease-like (RecB) superfamily
MGNMEYGHFLKVIKKSIRSHQLEAMRAVNRELVALYWEIGKAIQKKQEKLGWGKAVVETLAKDLQAEFPGRNGFSARNLWAMKDLYRTYIGFPKLQPLVAEIGWSKNVVIMWRCKNVMEREFYLRAAARNGWTKAVLQHQLDNKTYEKHLLSQSSFQQALSGNLRAQAFQAVKDHYSFEFLELAEEHSERELEQALIGNLRNFLTELGGDFAFMGSQGRLEVGGQEYFLDLFAISPQAALPCGRETEDWRFQTRAQGQDGVLSSGSASAGAVEGGEPSHRHHHLSQQEQDRGGIRTSNCQPRNRCGKLFDCS